MSYMAVITASTTITLCTAYQKLKMHPSEKSGTTLLKAGEKDFDRKLAITVHVSKLSEKLMPE